MSQKNLVWGCMSGYFRRVSIWKINIPHRVHCNESCFCVINRRAPYPMFCVLACVSPHLPFQPIGMRARLQRDRDNKLAIVRVRGERYIFMLVNPITYLIGCTRGIITHASSSNHLVTRGGLTATCGFLEVSYPFIHWLSKCAYVYMCVLL